MSTERHSEPSFTPNLAGIVRDELVHLRSHGIWFLLLGIFLVVGGTAAIIVPAVTVGTTFAVTVFLGFLLMAAGVAAIINSFWVGQWGGFFLQLLAGIIYVACGFAVTENPGVSAVAMTLFISLTWIVLGIFRSVSAMVIRFPQWGWSLLNGVVTMLAGVIIYRHLPLDAIWIIGLLVGLEMLFHGWAWIMLGMALRKIPDTVG